MKIALIHIVMRRDHCQSFEKTCTVLDLIRETLQGIELLHIKMIRSHYQQFLTIDVLFSMLMRSKHYNVY
jgi:hypothetical protein